MNDDCFSLESILYFCLTWKDEFQHTIHFSWIDFDSMVSFSNMIWTFWSYEKHSFLSVSFHNWWKTGKGKELFFDCYSEKAADQWTWKFLNYLHYDCELFSLFLLSKNDLLKIILTLVSLFLEGYILIRRKDWSMTADAKSNEEKYATNFVFSR